MGFMLRSPAAFRYDLRYYKRRNLLGAPRVGRTRLMRVFRLLLLCLFGAAHGALAEPGTVIKLGTAAPDGSIWHDALLQIRQDWRELSNGEVELRIYPGGVLGGEAEMVRKMQRGSLDAVAISGSGLPHLDRSVDCLNVPLLFDSYAELDHVRTRVAPEIERQFAERGFTVLNWADGGWVYFFSKQPVRTPDDLRALRLWIAAGSPEGESLFKQFGFRVVPLAETDMLTALQTGLIEAIDVPPLFALLDRSYQYTGYMTDLRWAPLNAATVINTAAWERIPAQYRPAMHAAAREAGERLRREIRRADDKAIEEMQARGLVVVELDADTRARWEAEAREAYPALRASMPVPGLFDEVLRLSEEYRRGQTARTGRD